MSRWGPCKRVLFIRRLRHLDFDGPFSGSIHQFMLRGNHRLAVPSNEEYSVPQLRLLIREVEGITGRTITARADPQHAYKWQMAQPSASSRDWSGCCSGSASMAARGRPWTQV